MQQLNLPSTNLANFSNVSKQSETLISGLNNITFDNYNNTCIFNNNMYASDKSVTLDLINKLFYNLESISFKNSTISGINDGYILNEDDELVLDYNPNNALNTVFGYNIKNQCDTTNNNLNVETISRQTSDNLIIDLIEICNKNSLHAESMIHYIDYDLINHQMNFFIPVLKEDLPEETNFLNGYLDNLSANNIKKLTESEIKLSNPKLLLTNNPTKEYQNLIVASFNKNGVEIPILNNNILINDIINNNNFIITPYIENITNDSTGGIKTNMINFKENKLISDLPSDFNITFDPNRPDPTRIELDWGILTGLDTDMSLVDDNIEKVNNENYKGWSLNHTICSFWIKYYLKYAFRRIDNLGLQLDFLTQQNYYEGEITKNKNFEDPFKEPLFNLDQPLIQKSNVAGYPIWEAIKNVDNRINELQNGKDKKLTKLINSFLYDNIDNKENYQYLSTDIPLCVNYRTSGLMPGIENELRKTTATLKVTGNIEVSGDIYFVNLNDEDNYTIKTKKKWNYDKNPNTQIKTFPPSSHIHSISEINNLENLLNSKANSNTVYTQTEINLKINNLENKISEIENGNLSNSNITIIEDIKYLYEMINKHSTQIHSIKNDLEQIKHQIGFNPEPTI